MCCWFVTRKQKTKKLENGPGVRAGSFMLVSSDCRLKLSWPERGRRFCFCLVRGGGWGWEAAHYVTFSTLGSELGLSSCVLFSFFLVCVCVCAQKLE